MGAMSLAPLFAAGPVVASHALAALAALVLGAAQFALPKGTPAHRAAGWLWVALMAVVAASGLFIHEIRLIGPFSPIHILSIVVLVTLVVAVRAARRGEVARHRRTMIQLYFLALIVAGLFTLLPGRVMHAVVFGAPGG